MIADEHAANHRAPIVGDDVESPDAKVVNEVQGLPGHGAPVIVGIQVIGTPVPLHIDRDQSKVMVDVGEDVAPRVPALRYPVQEENDLAAAGALVNVMPVQAIDDPILLIELR